MRTHELKTDPDVFSAVVAGLKPFELRKDDRGFAVGDLLVLRETRYGGAEMRDGAPVAYSGRVSRQRVTYVLRGPSYGVQEGWVVLGIAAVDFSRPPLPAEPPPGLIESMALRYDHALGCDGYYDQPIFATSGLTHQQMRDAAMSSMRQLYEEVSGHGFFDWPVPEGKGSSENEPEAAETSSISE
jgi:hypothetical protein